MPVLRHACVRPVLDERCRPMPGVWHFGRHRDRRERTSCRQRGGGRERRGCSENSRRALAGGRGGSRPGRQPGDRISGWHRAPTPAGDDARADHPDRGRHPEWNARRRRCRAGRRWAQGTAAQVVARADRDRRGGIGRPCPLGIRVPVWRSRPAARRLGAGAASTGRGHERGAGPERVAVVVLDEPRGPGRIRGPERPEPGARHGHARADATPDCRADADAPGDTGTNAASDARAHPAADTAAHAAPDRLRPGGAAARRGAPERRRASLGGGRLHWSRHGPRRKWQLRHRVAGPSGRPDVSVRCLGHRRASACPQTQLSRPR